MHHNAATFSERQILTEDTGCRNLKGKTLCGTFLLNVVVFTLICILCVQGTQESVQTTSEWLSSSGSWRSSSIQNGSVISVAKRQTEATSHEKPGESEGTSPKVEKPSQEVAADETTKGGASEPVTKGEESGGSADSKDDDGQVTEGTAGQVPPQPADQAEIDKIGTEPPDEHRVMPGLKGISSEAVLRGFYVFVGVGTIVLLYIVIKLLRLRRRRAIRKYRVLSHNDQEMFPLAADDGDDEEIYNAVDHQNMT